jgi:hypothetical protein
MNQVQRRGRLPVVIPAKAGTQVVRSGLSALGPRFRGDDNEA